MRTFKGILSLILYVVNLIGLAIIVLFAAFIALLMPTRGSKKYIQEHGTDDFRSKIIDGAAIKFNKLEEIVNKYHNLNFLKENGLQF